MMSGLRVYLFGTVRITHPAQSAESKAPRSAQLLLAYLLLHRHQRHSRDALSGLFWGEHPQDHARRALSTTLWRLRRVLEPPGVARGTYLVITVDEIGFNTNSAYWLDVAALEGPLTRALAQRPGAITPTEAQAVAEALALYRGDLLADCYDDWALRHRERLRALYLRGLTWLLDYYTAHDDYAQAITHGQQILQLDPLHEDVHRALMRLYLQTGQRGLAVRQYETCQALLAAELGVAPTEETQALYREVSGANRAEATGSRCQQAHRQIQIALRELDTARVQLERALRMVESLTGLER
jgi:DNA-binding SARP family transcriptional activator